MFNSFTDMLICGAKIVQAERNPKFLWDKKLSEEGGSLFPDLFR